MQTGSPRLTLVAALAFALIAPMTLAATSTQPQPAAPCPETRVADAESSFFTDFGTATATAVRNEDGSIEASLRDSDGTTTLAKLTWLSGREQGEWTSADLEKRATILLASQPSLRTANLLVFNLAKRFANEGDVPYDGECDPNDGCGCAANVVCQSGTYGTYCGCYTNCTIPPSCEGGGDPGPFFPCPFPTC